MPGNEWCDRCWNADEADPEHCVLGLQRPCAGWCSCFRDAETVARHASGARVGESAQRKGDNTCA